MAQAAQSRLQLDTPPLLEEYRFLFKDILKRDPNEALKFCRSLQRWCAQFLVSESSDADCDSDSLLSRMMYFRKRWGIHLVSVSDKFQKSLSSSMPTYKRMSDMYDEMYVNRGTLMEVTINAAPNSKSADRSHAENDRETEQQQQQVLRALLYLFSAAERSRSTCIPLSEDLIKRAHAIIMEGLVADGRINAGEYRHEPACDGGDHTYPDPSVIPKTMDCIVKNYNERISSENHDPYELAAWLLYELLTIHPFEDGNGRVSRLLWCYSLWRDGFPFPVIPFPERKRSYKKYVYCTRRDRRIQLSSRYKYLTSLTLISVTMMWLKFISYLKNESPSNYKELSRWLVEDGNNPNFWQ